MIRIGFGCDGARPTLGELCDFVNVPTEVGLDRAEEWIDAERENRGWVRSGGKDYCPQHNPALKGEEVTIRSGEYTELLPGLRVRLPGTAFPMVIEVLREDRACHGNVGAVCGGGSGPYEPQPREKPAWLAKPPLIPGT